MATLSNKLRTEFNSTTVVLTSSYQTLFTYSGSGQLAGFVFRMTGSSATMKLTIDTTDVIFELVMQDIINTQIESSGNLYGGGSPVVLNDILVYRPTYPIVYTSEVKIEAKDTVTTSKLRNLITLTKET